MVLALLLSCAWDAPVVPPTDDNGDPVAVGNVISGEIVASGVADPATTLVLLFDAADPGPPEGTGSPLTFTTTPASAFTSGHGTPSAGFALTDVPDGQYTLSGLMDVDGNFHPLLTALAGATCGDVVGRHLDDLSSTAAGVVTVGGGELVDHITVVLGVTLTTERPAFEVAEFGVGGGVVSREAAATDPYQQFTLAATGVHSEILELAALPADCGVYFPLYAPDADGDGQFDPHPNESYAAAGLYDLWPRVYLQYLGVPTPTEDGGIEFVSDLEPGESWAMESVPHPKYTLFGEVNPGEVVAKTDLDVLWVPAGLHTLADGTEETVVDPAALPAGAWSVTLVSFTGQTWTNPNELAGFATTDPSFDPLGQFHWVTVQ